MAKTAESSGGPSNPKSSKKRKREKTALEPVSESAADAGNSKFARALASPDWTTREKGLQVLTLWLKRRPDITDSDLNKIWKGLFYAFWHADKAPVQEALAARLAQIMPQLGDQVALTYFRVFFATMRREWFGIDRLRLDKFMMLVRKFVQQTFVLLRNADWDEETVDTYVDLLTEEVLLKEGGPPALGLVYHLADCYVPEILAADAEGPISAAVVPLLLSPFTRLLAEMAQPAGINRAMGSAFGPLLAACRPGEDVTPSFAQPQLLISLAQTAFELGAQAEVRKRNREALYQLSKQLRKAAKQLGAEDGSPAANGLPASLVPQQRPSAAASPASPAAPPAVSPAASAAAAAVDAVTAAAAKPSRAAVRKAAARKAAKKVPGRLAQTSTAADAVTGSPVAEQAGERQPAAGATPPQADAAVGPAAASTKRVKLKKRRASDSASAEAAAMNGSAAEPAGHRHTPRSRLEADAEAARGSSATPVPGSRAAGTLAADSMSEKKSVHFRLKHNLHFEHGGPVPSPEIRTPPNARPKGPALRTQPATEPGRLDASARKRQKKALKSPSSIPRSKAAAFF